MKFSALIFTTTLVLSACSPSKNTETDTQSEISTSISNKTITVEIEGMVCQKGCGSSIRKELKKMDGVSNVSFNYSDSTKTDDVIIDFDENKTSKKEIIKVIESTNKGQFKTISTKTAYRRNSSKTTKQSNNSVKYNASSSSIRNLFDVFTVIFIH